MPATLHGGSWVLAPQCVWCAPWVLPWRRGHLLCLDVDANPISLRTGRDPLFR